MRSLYSRDSGDAQLCIHMNTGMRIPGGVVNRFTWADDWVVKNASRVTMDIIHGVTKRKAQSVQYMYRTQMSRPRWRRYVS